MNASASMHPYLRKQVKEQCTCSKRQKIHNAVIPFKICAGMRAFHFPQPQAAYGDKSEIVKRAKPGSQHGAVILVFRGLFINAAIERQQYYCKQEDKRFKVVVRFVIHYLGFHPQHAAHIFAQQYGVFFIQFYHQWLLRYGPQFAAVGIIRNGTVIDLPDGMTGEPHQQQVIAFNGVLFFMAGMAMAVSCCYLALQQCLERGTPCTGCTVQIGHVVLVFFAIGENEFYLAPEYGIAAHNFNGAVFALIAVHRVGVVGMQIQSVDGA